MPELTQGMALCAPAAKAAAQARSLEMLTDAHYPWVQRMCVSLAGNAQEGQELAQEVMTIACRHFESLEDPQAFRPWLREVARNRLTDWLRRRHREERALAAVAAAETISASSPPEDPITSGNLDLHSAIAALPEEQRVAVTLHYFLGLRYREIARATNCPVGTVMSRLAAARAKLRRAIS